MSKTYHGVFVLHGECRVMVVGADGHSRPLAPRLDLYNHSPTGFAWGYAGSGPSQLALAILAEHFGEDRWALKVYQDFKHKVIAVLPRDRDFMLTTREISEAVAEIRKRA